MPAAQRRALLVLLLAATPLHPQAVRGTVRHPDGSAVPGARLALLDDAGAWRAEGRTDMAGAFLLPVPAPGWYAVRLERPGTVAERTPYVHVPGTDTVVLAIGAERAVAGAALVLRGLPASPQAPLALPGAATGASGWIEVRLLAAETRRPLSGAWVRLDGGAETHTDARGVAVLDGVADGRHALAFRHPHGGEGRSEVDVAGPSPARFDLLVPRGALALRPVVVTAWEAGAGGRGGRGSIVLDRARIERSTTAGFASELVRALPGIVVREAIDPRTPFGTGEVCVEAGTGLPPATRPCRNIALVVDDVPVTQHAGDMLRTMAVSQVERVELLSAEDARRRYPMLRGGVVLVVYTRAWARGRRR
jgi:hypothetical protein